jgi:hypothetical protein
MHHLQLRVAEPSVSASNDPIPLKLGENGAVTIIVTLLSCFFFLDRNFAPIRVFSSGTVTVWL